MRKQVEGDSRERRKKARSARRQGKQPADERVTTGASKQHKHLAHREDHDTKLASIGAGKQGGALQARRPRGRPRGRQP